MKKQNVLAISAYIIFIAAFAAQNAFAQTAEAQAAFDRGNAAYRAGNFDLAITEYTEVIRLAPNDPVGYNNRGYVYDEKGDYDRAIADYTKAIQLNPDYAEAYNNRGVAYALNEDYDRAIADFEASLRIDPNLVNAKQGLELAKQAKTGN